MKYIGTPDFTHGTEEKLGVLVVNLGTPQAPETRAVRKYLAQFLSDPRIIELPRWLWNIILHGIILRVRPSKSAKAYREVWSDETGSPLLSISQAQTAALKESLQHRFRSRTGYAIWRTFDRLSHHATRKIKRKTADSPANVSTVFRNYNGFSI